MRTNKPVTDGLSPGFVRWALFASALAAVFCLTHVGIAMASGPGPDREVTPYGSSIAWSDCGAKASLQCARVEVPLDWDRPGGRKIELAVIRHLASDPEHRIGSLFANPGGPGQSGVDLVRGDPESLDAWGGGQFDAVSWDPRGTNRSSPVRCFRSDKAESRFWAGASIPTSKGASKRLMNKIEALGRRCGRVSGWLLPHISTADTARDLDYLRRLVGDRKLTYGGLSYGTSLGETYANMYPGRVRAMMLDGIGNPVSHTKGAEARFTVGVSGADEVFDKFLSLCDEAGPDRCALAGGSQTAAERVERLFAKVKRKPIPAPNASPPGTSRGRLSYGDLLASQYPQMRDPKGWAQNAKDLKAALGGDASALETLARGWRTPFLWAASTTSSAIMCADAGAHLGPKAWPRVVKRMRRSSQLQGPLLAWWGWAPCAASTVRGQDSYRGPWNASTPNPILVIGTRYDPSSPFKSAERVADLLGNAVLLEHDGYGHLSYQDPSACIEAARTAYIVDLVTPPPGTVCKADGQPFFYPESG